MNRYPFLRLLLPLAAGIALADAFPWYVAGSEWVLAVLFLLLIPIYIYARARGLFGLVVYLLLFAVGYLLMSRRWVQTEFPFADERAVYQVRILEPPEEKPRSLLCRSLVSDGTHSGECLLYFPKDSLEETLRRGDELTIYTRLAPPTNFTNPDEFDYVRYLRHRDVVATGYVPADGWQLVGHDSSRILLQAALDYREKLISLYHRLGFRGDELAVLSALTVGYKDELSEEIRQTYTTSGAAHILALSGMHVALLFGLIWWAFLPLWKRTPFSRPLLAGVVILVLWTFAFFTGLSSSVVRAVVMCSLFVLSKLQWQKPLTLNTLAATAFLMLLVRPQWLFDVGFQLSFASVAAIILIQPRLTALFQTDADTFDPDTRLRRIANIRPLQYVRGLFILSIAAQIGAAPLVALYFHSFATHFLLTNLLVVPLSSLILYVAVLMLVLTSLPALQLLVVPVLNLLISSQNGFLRWVEQLPFASLTNLRFDVCDVALFYLSLFTLVYVFRRRTARSVQFFLLLLLAWAVYHVFLGR